MEEREKLKELAKKVCQKEHLTEDEWRLLLEAIDKEIDGERRKELH
jgi:DNA-directed RNA polymerase beta' subunit